MKKKLLRATALSIILSAFLLPSCEFLEDCGTCVLITEENGVITNEGTPMIFCGEQLVEKQNSGATTVGGVTTYWDCD